MASGALLEELRRRIEGASEASVVKAALAEAASLKDIVAPGSSSRGPESEWLSFLLDTVLPNWVSCFTAIERECLFDGFFMRADALTSLNAVHGCLCREGSIAEGLQSLVELIVRRVPQLLTSVASSSSSALSSSSSLWQMTLTALMSLPERMANRSARATPALHPKTFADAVTEQALSLSGAAAPIPSLVAALLGHVARLGHSDVVATRLLALDARLASSVCLLFPESSLQSLLSALLMRAPSTATLSSLLLPLYRRSALAEHLLSHKFLLTRTFPSPAPASLVALLVSAGKRRDVLERIASVWGEPAFLQQQLTLQNYVTDALLALLQGATQSEAEGRIAVLLSGVQRRLVSALPAVRTQGMRVGEALSAVATPGMPLKFDAKEEGEPETDKTEEKEKADVEMTESVSDSSAKPAARKKTCIMDGPDDPDRLVLDSNNDEAEEDEEDDLKPYDLRDDVQPTSVERPTYIRELISVLTSVNSSAASSENSAPARLEAAMAAAPEIIRSAAHELPTLSETLLSALLQVPEASRGAALQAVLATHPPSAVSVIKRFYEPNYALTTRAAMLDALIDAAHELARLPKSNAVPREAPQGELAQSQSPAMPALQVVGQVRRWAAARKPARSATANRFEAAVPHFFFPLLARADTARQALQLLSDDAALLARLLYAAGVFVLCAGSASAHIEYMSDELLALLWSLRFLPSAHLRRALLISVWQVFSTAPRHVLFSSMGRIEEWKAYLESVATDEPDDECRLLAHYDLSVLHSTLQQSGQ